MTRSLLLALPLATATLVATPARADDAANTATARALGIEGVTLADGGKCREAIEKLERAEKLHHAPTTATRLAECEIEVGRLVSGTERLQRVVREPLPPNAHPAFAAAAARAQKDLEAALPRIATLRLSVKAPAGAKLTITIDDEPAPDAILDSNRRIDPGQHKIAVTAYGCRPAAATTVLEEGQTKALSLELQVDPNAPPEPRADLAAREAVIPEAHAGSKVPAFIAFGVGAVGLGTGIAGAVTVASKSHALEGACDANRVCPNGSRSEIASAKQWATVSTVGFVTAGVGLVGGVVLLLASGAPSTPPPAPSGLRVRPALGMTSVGLDGVF
ncbi:MAG TPA: hypothetical protein VLT33_31690 [Labilithrix sp.]|nr:hypothetical protein [Labilithrix sp.]